MSRPKIIATCTVLFATTSVILAIPIPWHREAVFIIEPHEVRHVYVSTPGFLREQLVREGTVVKDGELLLGLDNPEKSDRMLEMLIQKKVIEAEKRVYESSNSLAELEVAQQKLENIKEQIAEFEQQLAELDIIAPCGGVIVSPQSNPEPKADDTKAQLTAWHGTPLQPRNLNCFVDERTHLLSVAPDDKFQATLLVDQSDRNDVDIGKEVELKFDHLPYKNYIGKIEKISDEDLRFVPPLLSNKLGGQVPSETDDQGRERLISPAYQTTVLVEEDIQLLRSGMRGTARFLVGTRSTWEWMWRYLKTTFHFRL